MSKPLAFLCGFLVTVIAPMTYADRIDGEELVDPTRPYGISDETPAPRASRRYEVQFIRAGGDGPVAVVNNKRVGVGELVDDAMVLAITRDRVTLLINGQEVEVRLNEGITKIPAGDL